jgi:hypothetical protein
MSAGDYAAIAAATVSLALATIAAWACHEWERQELGRRAHDQEAWSHTIGYQAPKLVPKNSGKPHGEKARPE